MIFGFLCPFGQKQTIRAQSKIGGLNEEQKVARLLAYVTGSVNQKLLLENEYLAAENRILRANEASEENAIRQSRTRHLARNRGSDGDVKCSQRAAASLNRTRFWIGISKLVAKEV